MIELSVQVSGESQVIARLEAMTDAIRAKLREAFEEIGPELRDRVASGAPPAATGHKDRHPGKLRRSIKARISENAAALQLRVGPPIFYGRFLEEGIPEKVVTVTRRGKLGRGIVGVRTRLTKSGTVLVSPRRGVVAKGLGATYTRRFHIDAHPFFGPALESMRARIMAGISEAVREGAG